LIAARISSSELMTSTVLGGGAVTLVECAMAPDAPVLNSPSSNSPVPIDECAAPCRVRDDLRASEGYGG
jgi:hypothetical protein